MANAEGPAQGVVKGLQRGIVESQLLECHIESCLRWAAPRCKDIRIPRPIPARSGAECRHGAIAGHFVGERASLASGDISRRCFG